MKLGARVVSLEVSSQQLRIVCPLIQLDKLLSKLEHLFPHHQRLIKIVLLALLPDLLNFDANTVHVVVDDYLQREYVDIWLDLRCLDQSIEEWSMLFQDGIELGLDAIIRILLQPQPFLEEPTEMVLD